MGRYALAFSPPHASAGPVAPVARPWRILRCSLLPDLDCSGFVAFRPRYEKSENAVAIFGLNHIGVDLDRHRKRAIEDPEDAFAPVDARRLVIGDGLATRDADRVLLRLDVQVLLVDAGQFDDRDKIISFLEDVDW